MSKLRNSAAIAAVLAGVLAGSAPAAILGPQAAQCRAPGRPAMLVKVVGLKARTGLIRVQSYGGDPEHFFDKGSYLTRIEVAPPAAGPVEVCLPVPREGVYAVSVRHDVNGSGASDSRDGGGMSGNPELSLFDVMLKRRPDPARVSVRVGAGVVPVSIVLRYVQGGSFRPIASAAG